MKDFLGMDLLQGAFSFDFDSMEDEQVAKDLKNELSADELKELAPKAHTSEQTAEEEILEANTVELDKNDPLYEYKKAKEYEKEQMELNEYIKNDSDVFEDYDKSSTDEEDDYSDMIEDEEDDYSDMIEDEEDDYSDLIDEDGNQNSNEYGDFDIDSIIEEAEAENKKQLEHLEKPVVPEVKEVVQEKKEIVQEDKEDMQEDSYESAENDADTDSDDGYFDNNEEDDLSQYLDDDEDLSQYLDEDEDLSQYIDNSDSDDGYFDSLIDEAVNEQKLAVSESVQKEKEVEYINPVAETPVKEVTVKENSYTEDSDDDYGFDYEEEEEDLSQYLDEEDEDLSQYLEEDEDLSQYIEEDSPTEVAEIKKENCGYNSKNISTESTKDSDTNDLVEYTLPSVEDTKAIQRDTEVKNESLNEKDHSEKKSIDFYSKKEQEMQERIRILELEKQMLQQQYELERLRNQLQQKQGDGQKDGEISENKHPAVISSNTDISTDSTPGNVQNNTKKPGVVKSKPVQNKQSGKKLLTIEDFDNMDESLLIRYVESYMIKQGVKGQLIDKNLLMDKFGAANIKRLLRKNKLISFKGGITLAV